MDIALLCLAYGLGSIPFGLLLTKRKLGLDVRQIGSGNIGATNVLRTGDKKLAALTLLLDAGKSALAVGIAHQFTHDLFIINGVATLSILGHMFPVWLMFQGGKGIASLFGAMLMVSGPVALSLLGIWVLCAKLLKISSLAALIALSVFAGYLLWATHPFVTWMWLVVIGAILWRHKSNITRLWKGQESHFVK